MMQLAGSLPTDHYCALARVSRASLYRSFQPPRISQADVELRNAIQQICLANRRYGYRRVMEELVRQQLSADKDRVLRIMREDNLLCLRKKKYVVTTDSDHELATYPNLTRQLVLAGVNQLWVADITYIRLGEEFVYLSVILDAFSRRVLGWELDERLHTEPTLRALEGALRIRQPPPGLIHHSDRGVQYCSKAYTRVLQDHGVRISMSRPGSPWENAKAESFMKTLKNEEVSLTHYQHRQQARASIAHFIEDVYNVRRLHSALDYQSPEEFEAGLARQKAPDSYISLCEDALDNDDFRSGNL